MTPHWRSCVLAVLVSSVAPASADGGKTVPGRCLAILDGRTRIDNPCFIDLAAGGGFIFSGPDGSDAFHVIPGKDPGTARGSWTGSDKDGAASQTHDLGPMHRQGACWTNLRARICARSDETEMLENRTAPYTDFRPLVGHAVQAHCRMGECQWFRFDSATLVAHDASEALFAIEGKAWTVDYPPSDRRYRGPGKRQSFGTTRLYARCSRTRPALIERDTQAGWTLYALAPGTDEGASGAAEYLYTEYAAACHGRTGAVFGVTGVLLGYSADDDQGTGEESISTPADALK